MNLKKELTNDRSKEQIEKLAMITSSDEELFAELIELMLSNESPVNQRAAWVLGKCIDYNQENFLSHLPKLINALNSNNDAIKRNILRALQFIDIPENLYGIAADRCFNILESKSEAIAIKVFAMTVLGNMCQFIPELKNELRLIIEDQIPYGSAGFKSRAKRVLRKL